MKSQRNRKKGRFLSSQIFLIVGLIIAGLVAFGYGRAYYQNYKVMEEIKQLEEEVASLKSKKLESMEILEYVVSQNYVEDKARTELNMKQPDENVVFVDRLSKKPSTQVLGGGVNSVDEMNLNNPMKWWYYFTHKSIN